MQLSKLSADDCYQQIQGKVGADHNQAEVVDDHHIANTVQQVVHLCRGPALQRNHLQHLQQSPPNVVKGHVALHTQPNTLHSVRYYHIVKHLPACVTKLCCEGPQAWCTGRRCRSPGCEHYPVLINSFRSPKVLFYTQYTVQSEDES